MKPNRVLAALIALTALFATAVLANSRRQIDGHSTLRTQVFVSARQPIAATNAHLTSTALSALTVNSAKAMTTTLSPGIGGRNLIFTFVDADTDSVVSFRCDGYDQWNRPISERFPTSGTHATSSALTITGTKIFTTVTSCTPLSLTVGDTTIDTVVVGTGNKLGLPFQFSTDLHELKQASLSLAADTTITVKTINDTNFDATNFAVNAALFASSAIATGDQVQILYFSDGSTPDNIDFPSR